MVFKRRNPRSVWDWARQMVYPTGGFLRAIQYVRLRLTRLPDEPHRIARGVFAGVFVSFTPFFGFHFLAGGLMAWLIRGNILAALLATFVGNPLTTPFIALTSVEFGHWLLDVEAPLTFLSIVAAFTNAGNELWQNFKAIFTADVTHWDNLARFWETIYLPYLVGGILPGLIVSLLFYWGTIPVLHAYQKIRANKLRERIEKRHADRDARRAKAAEATFPVGDDGQPPVG
jgi:uncharacterized protein (DUF2062 family)